MTQPRPMPRRVFLPDWVWAAAFVGTIVGSWFIETLWFVLALALLAMLQGIYAFHIVRCPICRGRLKFQPALIPHTTRVQFRLACSHCQVVWSTGKVFEDRTD